MNTLSRRKLLTTAITATCSYLSLDLMAFASTLKNKGIPVSSKSVLVGLKNVSPGVYYSVNIEGAGPVVYVSKSYSKFTPDGVKVIKSAYGNIFFIIDEYDKYQTVRPEWYGCKGVGKEFPDTIPFANMLSSLNTGDNVKLSPKSIYYNSYPNRDQKKDGWVISANKITLEGNGSTISRDTPFDAKSSGYASIKITGDNCTITGNLLITSDDPTGKKIMDYQSTAVLDNRNIFCSPVANTLNLWAYGAKNLCVDKDVVLRNAVFNLFANHGSDNIKILCSAISSGQIYPQPKSKSSDLALGSSFKLDRCNNITIDAVSMNTAYAGVELEGHNNKGNIKIKTIRAYHAGLHIWNSTSNIDFNSYAEDITDGGGLIIGPGCSNCNGISFVKNASYAMAFVGDSSKGDITNCNVTASGENVSRGIEFYARSVIDNASIRGNIINLSAKYGNWGGGKQYDKIGVVLNGGEGNKLNARLESFDYIFSVKRGSGNTINVTYDKYTKKVYRDDSPFFSNNMKLQKITTK